MNLRKVTSLTALLSFTVLVITGSVLFLTPQGRVAYWSEWRLWGFTKEAWGSMHILLSLLFLVTSVIHIVLNWGPIVQYLRDRAKRISLARPDFLVATGLTALFVVGPLFGWPPFKWVMDLNTFAKDQASRTYGEPPYGHAEQSSLQSFAQKTSLDLPSAKALLLQAGIKITGNQDRLQDIAKRHGMTPQQVYQVMKPAELPKSAGQGLPEEVAPGLGRKTLEEFCKDYRLDIVRVQGILRAHRLKVEVDQPFRALAEANGIGPHELYTVIRDGLK